MELPVGARDQHHRMAQGACARGRAHRLRSVAAHPRLGEEGEGSARQRAAPSWCAVERNPIDEIWKDRPEASKAHLVVQPDQYAGKSAAEKRTEIGDWLAKQHADAAVLSALDSIAWAFNIRGADVTHTPVALAYALVNADGTADLFVAGEKIGPEVRQHLGNGVRLHERVGIRKRAGRAQGQDRRRRPGARRRGDLRGARQGRRQDPAAARPDDPAQGAQEPGRDRRPEGRAGPATARPSPASSTGSTRRRPKGDVDELIASDQLEALRRENPGASRPVVRQHLRRRARTARSSTTGRARRPTASSRRARSI